MKKARYGLIVGILTLFFTPFTINLLNAQDVQPKAKLFIGGGALPEPMYQEFLKLTGPEAKLVIVPTATGREVEADKIQEQWKARGFSDITVLHTRDREVASSPEFYAPLQSATAVWFSGGSQSRIADAYLGTPVEQELYHLLDRGGIIGGSSAGAAIQTKTMIKGGKGQPEISTGFELLPNAILDQHFLKRNRLSRLISAIRSHPDLIGYGIDEGTAILVFDKEYKIIGESYVLRVAMVNDQIQIDAFEDGDVISLTDQEEHKK